MAVKEYRGLILLSLVFTAVVAAILSLMPTPQLHMIFIAAAAIVGWEDISRQQYPLLAVIVLTVANAHLLFRGALFVSPLVALLFTPVFLFIVYIMQRKCGIAWGDWPVLYNMIIYAPLHVSAVAVAYILYGLVLYLVWRREGLQKMAPFAGVISLLVAFGTPVFWPSL